ncbi:acetylglutamate kinase [Metabacillus sediminilitoris]|jgi:acetylglutamate kinase|uniref:Acetylglutamate kinase n=1 Tax=Metabacillus sediminilitoris TaxID=2567941 RepID=A0A4S4BV49_9BACI|nr:acetylglutamate kinase [Metabacillus sediminilitoris]QGQ44644.1 acetylglutamate kinase [Metabacillus sediminilitoris]THF79007.1 acetylglutamate kinase [Metabacillus sediminilitoris]
MSKTVVLKCGGSTVHQLSESFFQSLKDLIDGNWKVVIVHGGGPDITNMLNALKIETEFVNGQRKTSEKVLEIAEMVLAGKINKHLTNLLQQKGLKSIGLSGSDGELLQAAFLDKEKLGLVGKVTKVNEKVVSLLMENGYIPVIAPLARTETHETLNVNADLAAAAIAHAIGAEKFLFVTDVPGILDEKKQLIENITPTEIEALIESEVITGGMIPKVQSAIATLSDICQEVMIVSGQSAFVENDRFKGTKIVEKMEVISS